MMESFQTKIAPSKIKVQKSKLFLAAIVFGLIRTIAVVADFSSLQADPDAYRALAEGWSASGTFGRIGPEGIVMATAYRSPLYPWILAWLVGEEGLWLPGVAALHVVLGCVTCLLTCSVTRKLVELHEGTLLRDGSGARVRGRAAAVIPWIAGFAVAFDPILIRQSSLVMTETLSTFMAVLIWWLWIYAANKSDRIRAEYAIAIGAILGLSCLLRTSFFAWSVLLIAGLAIFSCRATRSTARWAYRHTGAVALLAGVMVVIAPWAIRNRIVLGSTIWTTTHGGYTLLLANNPILFQHFEREGGSRKWDEEQFHHRWSKRNVEDPRKAEFWSDSIGDVGAPNIYTDEVLDDRLANQTAWSTIARSPIVFAKAFLIRIGWFWALWPAPAHAILLLRCVIAGWYSISFSLVLYGSWRGIARLWSKGFVEAIVFAWLPAVSLVVSLTAVHAVYWSNMRMRAPLTPILAAFAAMALGSLWKAFIPRSSDVLIYDGGASQHTVRENHHPPTG